MTVRALLTCTGKEANDYGTLIAMMAVYDPDDATNKEFSDATPSAGLNMYISKGKPAADAFEVGKRYFVDISPA